MHAIQPAALRLFAGLLVLILVTSCATTGEPRDWAAAGGYEVRHNTNLALDDPSRDRQVSLQVAWPQTGGPFPVVVFSHGAFCYPQQYRNVTDFWVSHGYVVILPDHLDSPNLGKVRPQDLPILQESRVRDMSFVLDSIAAIEQQVPAFAIPFQGHFVPLVVRDYDPGVQGHISQQQLCHQGAVTRICHQIGPAGRKLIRGL